MRLYNCIEKKLYFACRKGEIYMSRILSLLFLVPAVSFATSGNMAGSGTKADPWQVADYEDLKKVGVSPYTMNGHYRLVADIDASASNTETFPNETSSIKGFKPIGMFLPSVVAAMDSADKKWSTPFSGTFNGAGHKISNLMIYNFAEPSTGFFSQLDSTARLDSLTLKSYFFKGIYSGGVAGINRGTINEVHVDTDTLDFVNSAGGFVSENYGTITNSSFSGTLMGAYVGGIAYDNFGTISKCNVVLKNGDFSRKPTMFGGIAYNNKGTISDSKASGEIYAAVNIGGIVSVNTGKVERCSSSVDIYGAGSSNLPGINITNAYALGGLIAIDSGKVYNSHATGNVTATGNNVGGFVGVALGEISGCSASGKVKALAYSGAFVGTNRGKIDSSFATGKMVGSAYLGGFVSYNHGEIRNSYATGGVDASASSGGGFVARNETTGIVENCYATGNVNSYVYAGGFASENAGKISKSHAVGHVQGGTNLGGFVGKQERGSIELSYATGYVYGEIAAAGFAGVVSNSTIDQCYATGDVLEAHIEGAGFASAVSKSTVSNSFSTGNAYSVEENYHQAGAFIAVNDTSSIVKNSFSVGSVSNATKNVNKVCATDKINGVDGYYWNVSNCSVVDTANYGIALTSEQMKTAASFSKFDFEKVWTIAAGAAFPTLKNVSFVADKKDSTGFFGVELERYNPSDNPGPRIGVNSRTSIARMMSPYSCRYEQGAVHVAFAMTQAGKVDVRILDFQGRVVAKHSNAYDAGTLDVRLDASRMGKGRYLAVLRLDGKIIGKSSFIKK